VRVERARTRCAPRRHHRSRTAAFFFMCLFFFIFFFCFLFLFFFFFYFFFFFFFFLFILRASPCSRAPARILPPLEPDEALTVTRFTPPRPAAAGAAWWRGVRSRPHHSLSRRGAGGRQSPRAVSCPCHHGVLFSTSSRNTRAAC